MTTRYLLHATLAVAILAGWWGLRSAVQHAPARHLGFWLGLLMAATSLCLALAGSARLGQRSGIMATALGAVWLVGWLKRPGLGRSAVGPCHMMFSSALEQ